MIEEGLTEIQAHKVTRAARAAATEAGQTGQPDEDALRKLEAGKEPAPGEDRAGEERRRPHELVIKLAGIGRSADQTQHRSAEGDAGHRARDQQGRA